MALETVPAKAPFHAPPAGLICLDAVFFTTFLPQFVPGRSASFSALLGLGLIFCAITICWLLLYAVVAARISEVLRRRRVQRAIDGATGVVLVGFGLRLATEHR